MSQEVETDASAEKNDRNEVDSEFGSGETVKPVEVDCGADENEPSTSAEAAVTSELPETREELVNQQAEPELEDAGKVDVSMGELLGEESADQITFNKNDSALDETLNETAQTEPADTTDYMERSINISQLNVEHHDDESNDAFNALKEAEVDALQEPKEEIQEPKEEPEEFVEPKESEEPVEKSIELDDETEDQLGGDSLAGAEDQLAGTEDELGGTEDQLEETESQLEEAEDQLGGTVDLLEGTEDKLGETEDQIGQAEDQLDTAKDQQDKEKLHDLQDESQEALSVENIDDSEITDATAGEETLKDAETPMETDENVDEDAIGEKNDESSVTVEIEESRESGTETCDFDNLMNDDDGLMGPPADVDKPLCEDIEDIPDGELNIFYC